MTSLQHKDMSLNVKIIIRDGKTGVVRTHFSRLQGREIL
jgi:hypothetical protein